MRIKPFLKVITLLGLTAPNLGSADGLAGSYLAGNHANYSNDYQAAARYYSKALLEDSDDAFILQNALLAYVITGEMDTAIKLSREISNLEFGSQLSDLMILASYIQDGDYKGALNWTDEISERLSPLLHGLLKGWLHVGAGDMSSALTQFDTMQSPRGLKLFGQFHKALAVAMAGDYEMANEIISDGGKEPLHLNRGAIIAHVQILSQLEDFEKAHDILTENTTGTSDQQMLELLEKITAKQRIPFDYVTSAADGISESFLSLASVLSEEDETRISLIYARVAHFLKPNNIQAVLLLSGLLKDQQQYDLATEILTQVPSDHPLYLSAEISRADTLVDAEQPAAAVAVLQGLASSHNSVPRVYMALGDVYSDEERYLEASKTYTKALELLEENNSAQWFLYYARAVSYERIDEWEKAEADFRKALKLSPNQPAVLNYLGYSLVEKRIKLDEAQEMIEQAVKGRPDDGFITDSLGWVLYRVGKFKEAVQPMERAAELLPTDPIINDHLGDVYWMVGREREARFQWSRAMSFEPEPKDAERIRKKLDVGLDEVLQLEAAEVSNAN